MQALIFDFDGTLVDSDEALLLPFDSLGIDRADVVMGSAVAEECERLGIPMETYVDLYDDESVEPFPGVAEVIPKLARWALCSNKHPGPVPPSWSGWPGSRRSHCSPTTSAGPTRASVRCST